MYKQALQIQPCSSDALCGYANLKAHNKEDEAATQLYQQALSADPAHVATLSRYCNSSA
jgi:cytochrome c-type biogenesis protein CcmH/NrfG